MIRQWVRTTAVLCGLSSVAMGQPTDKELSNQEMADRIRLLEKEMSEMRARSQDTWLSERRKEEIREIVQEVIQDSDTRASLAAGGATAGHNGKNFFLTSEDGKFLLLISGQIQARYIVNSRQNTADGDDDLESGIQMRRVKVGFDGHIGDPRFEFKILMNTSRSTSAVELEDAYISYALADGLKIWGGRFMNRFAREQIMSSKNQLAVDRSIVANVFAGNDGYVEGLALEWAVVPDMAKISVTVNDGLNSGAQGGAATGFQNGSNDFAGDASDFAVTGRIDLKLAGDWAAASDANAWSSNKGLQAFVGAAVHYENGESGDDQTSAVTAQTGNYDSFIQWTVDALVKTNGLSVMAAVYGWHFDAGDSDHPAFLGDTDHYAFTVQAGFFVIPDKLEPFARYEWIEVDDLTGGDNENLQAWTFGANYYLSKHASKLTADVVWELEGINTANRMGIGLDGIGLQNDTPGEKNQLVWRIQYQLLF